MGQQGPWAMADIYRFSLSCSLELPLGNSYVKKSSLTSLGRAINHSAADRSNLLREHLLGEAVDESANYRISEGETQD